MSFIIYKLNNKISGNRVIITTADQEEEVIRSYEKIGVVLTDYVRSVIYRPEVSVVIPPVEIEPKVI